MRIHTPIAIVATLFLLSLFTIGKGIALGDSFPPLPEALEAMLSDDDVTVREVTVEEWKEGTDFYFAFEPRNVDPTVGFIFYPGGLVDPRSYAPPAHSIAAEGYLTVIVKMPDDLAVYGPKRADVVMSDYPVIEKWIIGGHSIGGSFACAYAQSFTDKVDGVVLWASAPSVNFRLDHTELKAISIYGTNEDHTEELEAGAEHLPADAQFVKIEGANHSQFGWYDTGDDLPEGDQPADITREEQQAQIMQATLGFLGLVQPPPTTTSSSTSTTIPTTPCPAELLYGENSEEVELLRYVRDTILMNTPEGREIIKLYYQWSPVVVKALQDDEELKEEGKALTDGILLLIRGGKE